ncbi:MAG: hypothetical protein PHR01_10750 [Sphaerochaetaceae bacterium]|nr:hypothetical protein [Sphaerochaetaceae bacterium]
MGGIQSCIRRYTAEIRKNYLQQAFRHIISFMSTCKSTLESSYPDHVFGNLYPGYLDMTYFSCTHKRLAQLELKIALVYIHASGRFELWLAAQNKKIQSEYHELLKHKELGLYTLSDIQPGVDAIVTCTSIGQPDFDDPKQLVSLIENNIIAFTDDMIRLIGQ